MTRALMLLTVAVVAALLIASVAINHSQSQPQKLTTIAGIIAAAAVFGGAVIDATKAKR